MNRIDGRTGERKQWGSSNPTNAKLFRCAGEYNPEVERAANVPLKKGMDHAEIIELIRLGQDIHRQKCRENQRRFRKKQNSWINDIEKTNEQLRVEVADLTRHHQRITATLLGKNSIWVVVSRYFRLFRHGLALGSNQASKFNQQLDFVQSKMTPDVATSVGYGLESVMKSWRFLQWFDDVTVELEGLEGSGKVLTATTKTTATYTAETLRNSFPRLYSSQKGSRSAILADKLLGQRIVFHGKSVFNWDHTRGRVSSVQTQNDMLSPMVFMLRSLEDAIQVYQGALMDLNGHVKREGGCSQYINRGHRLP